MSVRMAQPRRRAPTKCNANLTHAPEESLRFLPSRGTASQTYVRSTNIERKAAFAQRCHSLEFALRSIARVLTFGGEQCAMTINSRPQSLEFVHPCQSSRASRYASSSRARRSCSLLICDRAARAGHPARGAGPRSWHRSRPPTLHISFARVAGGLRRVEPCATWLGRPLR